MLSKSCIYDNLINDHFRFIVTRWRLSNHSLKIETGRYANPYIPREEEACSVCFVLENEKHVLYLTVFDLMKYVEII